jgi:hypothetical protein
MSGMSQGLEFHTRSSRMALICGARNAITDAEPDSGHDSFRVPYAIQRNPACMKITAPSIPFGAHGSQVCHWTLSTHGAIKRMDFLMLSFMSHMAVDKASNDGCAWQQRGERCWIKLPALLAHPSSIFMLSMVDPRLPDDTPSSDARTDAYVDGGPGDRV